MKVLDAIHKHYAGANSKSDESLMCRNLLLTNIGIISHPARRIVSPTNDMRNASILRSGRLGIEVQVVEGVIASSPSAFIDHLSTVEGSIDTTSGVRVNVRSFPTRDESQKA